MKILFLDIDGVLNHPGSWHLKDPDNIDIDKLVLLDKIVDETDCWIVIHSSWRFSKSTKEIQDLFILRGFEHSHRIFDSTAMIDDRPGSIRVWLRECDDIVDSFVILDDLGLRSFEGFGKHLVSTSGSIGLTERDCEQVIRLFERQDNTYCSSGCKTNHEEQ